MSATLDSALVGTRFHGRGEFRRSLGSTNDTLRELASAGAPCGTFLIANEQTAGRGRRGKSWSAPAGLGLYLSVLLRPGGELPATLWTLGAAVAACDACRGAGAAPATTIKWPNDLLIERKKVGGILVEARNAGAGADQLIVGIGINVHQNAATLSALSVPNATSLRLAANSGIVGGRTRVAGALLVGLDRVARALEQRRWPEVEADWLERSPTARGAAVAVHPSGGKVWRGQTAGLAADGALRVRDDADTLHTVRQVDAVIFEEGTGCC